MTGPAGTSARMTSLDAAFFSLERTYGASCPSEATRWAGINRGCFQNAEADRLTDAIRTTVDTTEQARLYREYARLQSDLLPALPLFFAIQAWLFRDGVRGIRLNPQHRDPAWNVAEWDLA